MSSTQKNDYEDHFPIRTLSLETGVNTVTLRAWERRYGLLKPIRTPKGHRLYNRDDIETVRKVLHWVQTGVPVGKVKALLNADIHHEDSESTITTGVDDTWLKLRSDLVEAACTYQEAKILGSFQNMTTQYPIEVLVKQLIEPVLGELYRRDDDGTAYGYFGSILSSQVSVSLSNYKQQSKNNPKILVLNSASNSALWSGLMAMLFQEKGYDPLLLSDVNRIAQWQHLIPSLSPDKCFIVCEGTFIDGGLDSLNILEDMAIPIVVTGSKVWLEEQKFKKFRSNVSVFATALEGALFAV